MGISLQTRYFHRRLGHCPCDPPVIGLDQIIFRQFGHFVLLLRFGQQYGH